MTKSNLPQKNTIDSLDAEVVSVIGSTQIQGFQKAFIVATAIGKLRDLLTPEYMEPIMKLQGNRLGFKTDRDKNGGYKMEEVRECVIEAVLMGLEVTGNKFNIIAGNTYPTKEGMGHLLSKIPGLWYEIVPELPRVNANSTSAAVVMNVRWSLHGGEKNQRPIEIPVKMNTMMGTDAVIGKATRKARAWLHSTITGCEIADGDVSDAENLRPSRPSVAEASETEERGRALLWIGKAESVEDLEFILAGYPDMPQDIRAIYDAKEAELVKKLNP